MRLNNRLKMIANMVPPCGTLADIGTDHAYIPIYAVGKGICRKALAVDIKPSPVAIASFNIKKHGLESSIEVRQGDGLEPVGIDECDVVVIAGMGGMLIKDILSSSLEKAKVSRLLLLQPNSSAEVLRAWLFEYGFSILCERLSLDAGKIYCAIAAAWTGIAGARDEFASYVGEKVFEGNDYLLKPYLEGKLREVETIIAGRSMKRGEKSYEVKALAGRGKEDAGMMDRRIGGRIGEMDTETCLRIREKLWECLDR